MGMKGTNGKTEYISKRIPRDSRREFQDMGLILMTSGISIYGHKRDKDGIHFASVTRVAVGWLRFCWT